MDSVYVYIVIGHVSFCTGKTVIVKLPPDHEFISTYKQLAKEKACEKLSINVDDAVILNFKYLGEDVTFID